ncbi:MAG: hypothetical protein KKE93_02100 [Nanoarchaeota archaeon]|nr:hypothetical protein [Nanoarchaeota archaeon]
MIYLKLYWLLLALFVALYLISIFFKISRLKNFLSENGLLFFIILVSFVFIAILTNDPLPFLGVEIPVQVQWLGSLLISGFGAWKFYLHPLKDKVYGMDKELGKVGIKIDSIDSDVKLIKEKIINGKVNIPNK